MTTTSKQDCKHLSDKSPSSRASSKESIISNALLEPWFLSLETAKAVLRMIPRAYFSRMRWFFEDYGCLRCGKSNLSYGSNGLCVGCRRSVARCLLRSMKRRLPRKIATRPQFTKRSYITRTLSAEKILGDLVAKGL